MRLIDADELKEQFNKKKVVGRFNTLLLIDNAPTVPLPDFKEGYKQAIIDGKTNFSIPKGEWISVDDNYLIDFKKCSNCGEDAEWLDGGSQFLSNFCPNCGADMRGEKE